MARPVRAVLAAAVVVLAAGAALAAEEDTTGSASVLPPPGDETAAEAPPPSRGPRDPFRPFTLELQPKKAAPPKTPLQQYDLGALKLVAVIWGATPKAMVEDAGGLGYTITIGTPIGQSGGVVKSIQPDEVVVEEEFVDFYGEKKKSETVLKLKPEGEKRP